MSKNKELDQFELPHETEVNFISEGTRIEGDFEFDQVTRVYGTLKGKIVALPGSTLILGNTALIEGNIDADSVFIDGYVRGNVIASSKVTISRTGRVLGNVSAPNMIVESGAFFEGKCSMQSGPTNKKQAQAEINEEALANS